MFTFNCSRLRFLLSTFGSLGDLHPYIAVGIGLRDRGHDVTIATSEVYRAKVEGEGLKFHAARPDVSMLLEDRDMMRRAFHPRTGSEYIMRHVFLPPVAEQYADLLPAAREADVLVGHPLAFALPTAAEVLGKPWVSVILQPAVIFSAYDPPTVSAAPLLEYFRGFGPGLWRQFGRMVRWVVRGWSKPISDLRASLGLPALANPALDDIYSPFSNQAWFSGVLAQRQADWPTDLKVMGFPAYDRLEPGQGLSPELDRFLNAGARPVVFTLGSSAVFDAGSFYEESFRAVKKLGIRAVLLVGLDAQNRPADLTRDVFVAEYAPFSELFGRAAAVVHQGGAGTTAAVLRAGVPAIFVPFSHDQPDNARRVSKLGCARVIPRNHYKARRVARELEALLKDPALQTAAQRVACELAREDCVNAACNDLERVARQFTDAASRNQGT
ncbi:MAG: glucosyltransferase [Bryobacterales bacterium]|nr:glucosyltransferase [Bryobacterales bacterium]